MMKFKANSCECGNLKNTVTLFYSSDFNFNTTNTVVKILRCKICNSIFPELFPEDRSIKTSYQNYYTRKNNNKNRFFRTYLKTILIGKNNILRYLPQSAKYILDYGCGSGDYLLFLKQKFKKKHIYGTDIKKPRNAIFSWIPYGSLFKKSSLHFDWITLNHVIEHVTSPEILLKELSGILREGGGIWIATPNSNSFLISTFEEYARDIDFPRHKIIFSKTHIKSILESLNFEVIFLEPPRLFVFFNYLSSFTNVKNSKKKNFLTKVYLLGKTFFALLHFMVSPLSYRSLVSPEIYLIAKLK